MVVWKGKHIVGFYYYNFFKQLQHQIMSGHISYFNGISGEYQIQSVTYFMNHSPKTLSCLLKQINLYRHQLMLVLAEPAVDDYVSVI